LIEYDYLGRRVQKKYSTYNGSSWTLVTDQRFVYDGWTLDTPRPQVADGSQGDHGLSPIASRQGWNMVMVVNSSGTQQQSYTWGLDKSGPLPLDTLPTRMRSISRFSGRSESRVQGAGGVGGLLAVLDYSQQGYDCWCFHDGNGNVT